MTYPPQADGSQIVRRCPQCDTRFALAAIHAGATVDCNRCGCRLGPEANEPADVEVPEHPTARKRMRPDAFAGWGVSTVVHFFLILSLVGVTWLSEPKPDEIPAERPVAVVPEEEEQKVIEAGSVKPMELQPSKTSSVFPVFGSAQPISSSRIERVTGSSSSTGPPSKIGDLIGVEGGSGGAGGSMEGEWSNFAAGGGGQGDSGAEFFGLRARGGNFAFVVDRSSSMSGERFRAAVSELIQSVSSFKRGMKFYIIFFSSSHMPMPARGLVKATDANKRHYIGWVRTIHASGGTDPTSGMLLALSLKPHAIWLLSDGGFSSTAADKIRGANPGKKVQVHTIAFYDDSGKAVLARIAEENRGKYRFVRGPGARGRGRRRP